MPEHPYGTLPLPEVHQSNRKGSSHKSRFQPPFPVGLVTSAIVHQQAIRCPSARLDYSTQKLNSLPQHLRPTDTKKPPLRVVFCLCPLDTFPPHDHDQRWGEKFYLASRYFRRGLPPNYRCRCCVSHPSSRWIGVVPQRYGHQDRSTALAIDPLLPGVIPENCIGYFKASCQQTQLMASLALVIPEEFRKHVALKTGN
jgi:hypothetical protein